MPGPEQIADALMKVVGEALESARERDDVPLEGFDTIVIVGKRLPQGIEQGMASTCEQNADTGDRLFAALMACVDLQAIAQMVLEVQRGEQYPKQ